MSLATLNMRIAALVVLTVLCFGALAPGIAHALEADKTSAIIFAYQRIGDDSVPQGSLSLEQFKTQIQEMKSADYHVLPLADIVESLKAGKELPPKTIALTFDGAWAGTMKTVVPLLTEARMPFTIFVNSDIADQNSPQHATWAELKKLKKNKLAAIGMSSAAYSHMVDQSPEQNAATINKAISRFRAELGAVPPLFSYPYGEYSTAVKASLKPYDFKAAFGQQSGVAHAKSDMMALPRFTMTDSFGDFDRFLLTANALPLPVDDITPDNPLVTENPPKVGFTVSQNVKDLSRLACFVSGHGKVALAKPGGNRIELKINEKFEDRTTRINCTLPESSFIPGHGASAWRWFGIQLINPDYTETPAVDDDTPEEEIAPND